MRILLVEDDRASARGIAFQLQQQRMVVDIADCGAEALELSKLYDYDAMLVDSTLPDMFGYELVSRLRNARVELPIIMIASDNRSESKIRSFNAGADDYLVKPFDPNELNVRVLAMIRRAKGFSRSSIQLGSVLLDLNAKEVAVQGRTVHFTTKEYAILELLILRRGTALTKENFLDHLYGGIDEPDPKIIDVFICKVRRKLLQAGANNIISTIWGRGYMVRDDQSLVSMPANNASNRSLAKVA